MLLLTITGYNNMPQSTLVTESTEQNVCAQSNSTNYNLAYQPNNFYQAAFY